MARFRYIVILMKSKKGLKLMEIPLCKNLCDDITKFENFGFDKIKKSRYLENETFFLQKKNIINYTSRATLLQKIVLWRK